MVCKKAWGNLRRWMMLFKDILRRYVLPKGDAWR